MQSMILNAMPPQFSVECNRLRTNKPGTWRELLTELNNFDKQTKGRVKNEVQGRVYAATDADKAEKTSLDKMQDSIALLSKTVEKGFKNKGKGKKHNNNNKYGNHGGYYGKGKGGGKGKGKGKGKGRGKVKKVAYDQCSYCYQWGHWRKNCEKLKQDLQQKQNSEKQ